MKLNKEELKTILVYTILIIPFLGVAYFSNYDFLIKILKIVSILTLTIFSFSKHNKIKINKMTLILLAFTIYNFIISLLNSTLSPGIAYSLYFQLIIIVFLQQTLSRKDYKFLDALKLAYSLAMILNIPSLILQLTVSNYNRFFFLGGKNAIIQFALPTIFYNYISSYIKYGKLTNFSKIMIIISLVSPLICGSTTGFLVALLMSTSIALKNSSIINIRSLYIIYFIILFLLFNTELIESVAIVKDIIFNKFHKDLTFTGRTYIWEQSLQLIKNNPFGYGRGNNVLMHYFNNINECHNIFLQFLLDGGIPSLLFFVITSYYCNKNIKDDKKFIVKNEMLEFSRLSFFTFLFLGLTESVSYNINLWIFLAIINYLKYNNIEITKINKRSI